MKPSVAGVHDPFGGLLLKQCGYLNTSDYILAVRSWIRQEGFYLEEEFEENKAIIQAEGIEYQGWTAKCIILCQGTAQSKWFDWLPVRPLKGETITVRSTFNAPYVINRGVYVVPVGKTNEFRVGATYDFHASSESITPEARHELEEKFREIIMVPFEVTDQQWGFRPTVPDRRPIMGRHPEYKNIVVFNGLGTKGVSLAPYFSENLIRSLENDDQINKDADVNRYKSLYWKVPK
jgi:glycine/D-amino acid oxidase-like deaminating enzyme